MRNEEEAVSFVVNFDQVDVRYFRMILRRLTTNFEEHFLFSNRLVQFLIGLRPHQNSNDHFFLFSTVTVYVLPGILHQFYQLLTTDINLESSVKVLQQVFTATCILCTYSATSFKFVAMKKLCSHIKSDYDRIYDQEEFNIMEKYTKGSKVYTYLIVVIYFLYGCSLISSSIFNLVLYLFGKMDNAHLTLPISVNCDLSSWSYYSLLIYQVIVIYLLLTIASACFLSYWASIQHACSQFSIIIWKIHEPFEKHQTCLHKINYNRTTKEEFDWIFDIIKRFVRVTEFVELINDFSETIYFIIISLGLFLIIFNFFYMFQLSTELKRTNEIIECSSYIVSTLFTTYINFYIGQRLMNHSNAASNELCQVPYYVLSVKTQKLLLFAIMRSMKPCILSIGGMFVSSHEVFALITQKAFSFSTIYYNLR